MSDEPHGIRSFVEVWLRRVLTISSCVVIWLALLVSFPLLVGIGTVIDLARAAKWSIYSPGRKQTWIISRCALFFPFYFSCEGFGIVASFVLWLCSGVWLGASRARSC